MDAIFVTSGNGKNTEMVHSAMVLLQTLTKKLKKNFKIFYVMHFFGVVKA